MMRNYICLALTVFFVYTIPSSQTAISNDVTPTNNFTVSQGHIVCVVMTAAIQVSIPYIGQHKNQTATINLPSTTTSVGLCSPGGDTISLYFNTDWQLSIIISNTSASSYQWQKVSLTYKPDGIHFPNISSQYVGKSILVDTVLPDGTMRTPIGGSSSYTCAETLLQLNNSIIMNISSLQYRAFGKDNSTRFSPTGVQKCTVTMVAPDTDVALAVSVGISLGVMIVVVVLIYAVCSKVFDKYENRETV